MICWRKRHKSLPLGKKRSYPKMKSLLLAPLALAAALGTTPLSAQPVADSLALTCATTHFAQTRSPLMLKFRAASPAIRLQALGLPRGLQWDKRRHLVRGKVSQPGTYRYTLRLSQGKHVRDVPAELIVRDSLPLSRPPMGWISWNVVEDKISDSIVRRVADAFVHQGLREAGYRYLIIDDLWQAPERAEDGSPQGAKEKFPTGMKPVVDYVHARGLKFGIYSDAAPRTCGGAYGSLGYEEVDARTYAQWGVDLVKYDYCNAPEDVATAEARYRTMGTALREAGGILLYMCEWGVRKPWLWGAQTGASLWRATYDSRDCWVGAPGGIGVTQSIEQMKELWPYSGVNRYNDADMMSVGIHGRGKSSSDLCATGPGMPQAEYMSQFALWCMWSSPLMLSFDLTQPISAEDKRLITNADLIALNQDPLGLQAEHIATTDSILYLMKDLANGDVAISATNLAGRERACVLDFARFPALDRRHRYALRDCIAQRTLPEVRSSFSLRLAPHATAVYRLRRQR